MEQTDKYPVTKLLLPRYIDFEDPQFCKVCSRLLDIFKFQGWMNFLSEHRVYYPRLVSEFFHHKWYSGQFFQVKNPFVPCRETLFHS